MDWWRIRARISLVDDHLQSSCWRLAALCLPRRFTTMCAGAMGRIQAFSFSYLLLLPPLPGTSVAVLHIQTRRTSGMVWCSIMIGGIITDLDVGHACRGRRRLLEGRTGAGGRHRRWCLGATPRRACYHPTPAHVRYYRRPPPPPALPCHTAQRRKRDDSGASCTIPIPPGSRDKTPRIYATAPAYRTTVVSGMLHDSATHMNVRRTTPPYWRIANLIAATI